MVYIYVRLIMYRLVEVLWIDAEEYGEVGWNDLKAMKRYAKKPCPGMRSVGYVLHHSATHISLASTVGDKDCSTIEKIPCQFIKSITDLIRSDPEPRVPGKKEEREVKHAKL